MYLKVLDGSSMLRALDSAIGLATSSILLYLFFRIWKYGYVYGWESNRLVLVFETIMFLSLVIYSLARFIRICKR